MFDPNHIQLPLLLLYAETHYRFFPFFPSLLFKKEPEILFDMPRRLEANQDLPIVLIIHEHEKYPVELGTVQISISQTGLQPHLFKFDSYADHEINHFLRKQLKVFLFTIPGNELPSGNVFVNATLSITKRGRTKLILNDNLFSSSKLPFTCTITSESLPGNTLCSFGDLHNHSIYSQSHVEFGPPLQIIDLFAKVSGLSFIGITDHSYDIACSDTNYLVQDQSLKRWSMLSDEFTSPFRTIMLKGEEISCLNKKGKVVHLCGIGHSSYIPGTLDGARPNTYFPTQLTINQAVDAIHAGGGFCFAAHPGSLSGYLQSVFLHRGIWSEDDISEKLDGFQALNSGYKKSWNRGKELWIKMLQKGLRLPLLAGNDAHGDFNRYRAIGKPFLEIHEDFNRYMGYGKTGIYGSRLSQEQISSQIRNGSTFVTTGPYVSINHALSPDTHAISKTALGSKVTKLWLHAISTKEFGRIWNVVVKGSKQGANESVILIKHYDELIYEINEVIDCTTISGYGYIRAEVICIRDDQMTTEAYTSACFL